MIWLTWKLLTLPPRVAFFTAKLTVRAVLVVGIGRLVLLGAGVVLGLLVAPRRGEEVRREIRRRMDEARSGDLSAKVRHELAHSPRTWHLPQPTVSVVESTVVLTGQVPHAEAREDMGKAAMSVVGVFSVDNRLTVGETAAPSPLGRQ